jgi:uncharacterized iron-regulated protein
MSLMIKAFLFGSLLLSLSACTAAVVRQVDPFSREAGGIMVDDIFKTETGRSTSRQALLDELAAVHVVYVGETHTSIEDHRVQLEILRGLQARNPSIVLAMEMFPREVQPVLDRYTGGVISEQEFIEEVNWEKVWGYPFHLYGGLLSFARDNGIRVIGLNAPQEVVRKIARKGLSSLSPEDRSRIARDFHLDDPRHREYIQRHFNEHIREHIRDFDSFFEAQLAWEETMAETLAQTLLSGNEHVLVLLGKGHIGERLGVPHLTSLRVTYTHRTVAPVPINYPDGLFDPNIADFVWITDKTESAHRGRLGVMVRASASGQGLDVLAVAPDSPAEKAGIQVGDIIHTVDGTPVQDIESLHKAIAKQTSVHQLEIRRGDQEIQVTITLTQ